MSAKTGRRPVPAVSDEESADKVALLQRAAGNLRAISQSAQADMVEELLDAAQNFTHELAEAVVAAEGWKALYESDRAAGEGLRAALGSILRQAARCLDAGGGAGAHCVLERVAETARGALEC